MCLINSEIQHCAIHHAKKYLFKRKLISSLVRTVKAFSRSQWAGRECLLEEGENSLGLGVVPLEQHLEGSSGCSGMAQVVSVGVGRE